MNFVLFYFLNFKANIENASFGGTICAERSAICAAISSIGPAEFRPKAIAVVGRKIGTNYSFQTFFLIVDLSEPGSPCGICRQFLVEFGNFPVV